MNNLLLQLAMAALGQMSGGGGLSQLSAQHSIDALSRGSSEPSYVPHAFVSSAQPSGCHLGNDHLFDAIRFDRTWRGGRRLLERQGQTWGWPRTWGQRIPLSSVDQAIQSAGGCNALVQRAREAAPGRTATISATHRGRNSGGNQSEREGFGLAPYR